MPDTRSITRLLVANRGEIALRVMRACREMGIRTIAIYGDGEESAPHTRYADEAYRLRESGGLPYLDVDAVLDVARASNADAVHPGYGFLAENAEFARAVHDNGIVFVGPSPEAIASMGDKVEARRIAVEAGVPVVPGTSEAVATIEEALDLAREIGYPVAVKAAGGGGGRGFRVAEDESGMADAFAGSSGEAERYFSNPQVYIERYFRQSRHVEVQVFADCHGSVVALGERDCSIQRRHQKLIEETPSPAVGPELRQRLLDASVRLARTVGYTNAGTVEYLLDSTGAFYFLEMNTRIQVEHTVTEMVTGIDLVREQINVAMGMPLSFQASDIQPRGWAIECRINAEDAGRGFAPVPGTITGYREPVGLGIRVDGALAEGDDVQPRYDSLIAKLVAWGRDRDESIARMTRALEDFAITGPPTTIPFHLNVLAHDAFQSGRATTAFLADYPDVVPAEAQRDDAARDDGNGSSTLELIVEVGGRRFATTVRGLPLMATTGRADAQRRPKRGSGGGPLLAAGGDDLVSPIHGTVIRIALEPGATVETGQVVCVVEAMKMENELVAHKSGTVTSLPLEVGASVSIGQVVATIET